MIENIGRPHIVQVIVDVYGIIEVSPVLLVIVFGIWVFKLSKFRFWIRVVCDFRALRIGQRDDSSGRVICYRSVSGQGPGESRHGATKRQSGGFPQSWQHVWRMIGWPMKCGNLSRVCAGAEVGEDELKDGVREMVEK